MARKPAAVLLLGIWIGVVALEVASGFSVAAAAKLARFFNGTVFGFGSAIELSEDVDELPPDRPLPALLDVFPSTIPQNPQLRLVEKDPSQKRPEIYKLQHAFLL